MKSLTEQPGFHFLFSTSISLCVTYILAAGKAWMQEWKDTGDETVVPPPPSPWTINLSKPAGVSDGTEALGAAGPTKCKKEMNWATELEPYIINTAVHKT